MSLITSPEGYPRILFVEESPDGQTSFFLAPGLSRNINKRFVSPVCISNLTGLWGREKTNKFLKRFNSDWIISNGMIFFRKDCNAKTTRTEVPQLTANIN